MKPLSWILLLGAGAGVVYWLYTKNAATAPVLPNSGNISRSGIPSNTSGATVTQAASGAVASTEFIGSDPFSLEGESVDPASFPASEATTLASFANTEANSVLAGFGTTISSLLAQ